MAESLGNLARNFDELSRSVKDNARNSAAADDALAELFTFKGGMS